MVYTDATVGIVPVPLFASSHQVPAMHSRTAGNGWVNVSKSYQPPTPMPDKWNPETLQPAADFPEQVRPVGSRPERFGPQEPPQARPLPQTRFPSSPSTSVLAQVPADAATKSPLMRAPPFPITQQSPIPGPFPDPSTLNKLRSPRSISALADGRHVDNRLHSTLAASRSNLALNKWNRDSPQLGPGLPSIHSTSPSDVSGLWSPHTPLPSSLLNAKPTQTPPWKSGKPGFFSRLFGFGKPKYKEPTAPQPTKRLTKSTAPARPISTISMDTASSIAPRRRAILVKKPPANHPMIHSRLQSVLTLPGGPSLQQGYGHNSDPQPSYPPVRGSEPTTASHTVNYASSSINMDFNHTNAAANPAHLIGPTPGHSNQPYGTYRAQGLAATDHTQYPGTGNHYNQYPNNLNAHRSGTQDSGYQPLATTPGPTLCTFCNTNPRYTGPANGEKSPYCSDVCRAAATAVAPQTPRATCSYPGCTQPAVMYPSDHYWNYCSESHERYARKGCVSCRKADDTGTQLCKGCKETFKRLAPTIIPVPMDHDAFWHVVDKFSESWANPTQCPIFQAARVYKIMLTQDRRDTYLGYRDTLEYYGRFTAKGKSHGNERVLWHGTRRGCDLGEAGQTAPCMDSRCSLCSVIRGSSSPGKVAADMPAGRFGTGMYNFTKALKASDYSSNDKNLETPWVALILSKVAAGQQCVMRQDNTTLTGPPQGYDSVIGEVRGLLNYDELVVYTYDAVRPTWLVMYQRE